MPHIEEHEPYTVYTFGHTSRTLAQLDQEVKRLGAVVVDVRIQTHSSDFNRSKLQERYRAKYVWIKELGDKNYKTGGPTDYVDVELGVRRLGSITADGTPVILFCACKDYETCHRTELAKQLNKECGWKIQHLPYTGPEIANLFPMEDSPS